MYLYLLICITEYIPNRGGLRLGVNPPLRIFHIHWPTSNHSPGQIPQFTFMLQCYLWPKLLWNDPRWAGQWPQFLESNSHQRTAWETRYKMTMNCINMSHQSQLKVSPGHLLLSCLSKPLSTPVLLNLWRNMTSWVQTNIERAVKLFPAVQTPILWVHGYTYCWASSASSSAAGAQGHIQTGTHKKWVVQGEALGRALASQ